MTQPAERPLDSTLTCPRCSARETLPMPDGS